MMRWMMAALALIAASPAAAQTSELPLWIVGTWCLTSDGTKICIRYDPPVDGKIVATNVRTVNGEESVGNTSVTAIEDGVLVKRGSNGSIVREVSHGANEVTMEVTNPLANQARLIRYSVTGDVLTLEFTLPSGQVVKQTYRRQFGS